MNKEMEIRVNRLDALIREDRIIRDAWSDGHDRVCLLAALSPEACQEERASACPAEVMPQWLANLTPWLDDAPSQEIWPALVRRYAALARRWGALDTAAWERARIGVLIAIVSEARQHVFEAGALAAIDGVLAWLRRGAPASERLAALEAAEAAEVAAGGALPWAATRWAAEAASEAAQSAAVAAATVAAARSATWAAQSATKAAAQSAAKAAAAKEAALSAARVAVPELAAARAAARAAKAAAQSAADRIAASVLDAIEAEIVAAGGAVR